MPHSKIRQKAFNHRRRRLRPLLLDRSGDQITSWQHWLTERSWIESQWRDFLGPINVIPPPHTYSVVSSDMIDGCSRELIRYESEPGETVEAYLLWPALKDP